MERFDWVVVGQGLAGTAAAWHLRRGGRVLVLDRTDPAAASRAAAGLMTPVTGRRLVKTDGWDNLWPAAVAFYRRVEAGTGERFLHVGSAVRLFADEAERELFRRRAGGFGAVACRERVVNPDWFAAAAGGFEMTPAGRLDVPRYLAASRRAFAADGGFLEADLDPADVTATAAGVTLSRLGVVAGGLVFCQGFAGRANPWFPAVRFNPAKGEVLTLRVPGLGESRTVHRGAWLAPAGGELFRAGATYDRVRLDADPTDAGRAEIEAGVWAFLRLPFEVVGHAAGVRPATLGGRPVVEQHPAFPRLWCVNGLGSKGALLAPTVVGGLT